MDFCGSTSFCSHVRRLEKLWKQDLLLAIFKVSKTAKVIHNVKSDVDFEVRSSFTVSHIFGLEKQQHFTPLPFLPLSVRL